MNQPRSTVEWLLEGISLAAVIACIAIVAIHWANLPARIPTHFDAAGAPNGWGGRNAVAMLAGTEVGLWILLTLSEGYQRLINIPFRVDRESPEVRNTLRSMVITLKAAIMVSFVWLMRKMVETALGRAHGLGREFLPVFLALTFVPMILYLVKLRRFRQ